MNKYVSSLAFYGKTPEEIVEIAMEFQLAIEFSSGMPYRTDMEQFFNEAKLNKILHNYFPAPKEPFVLNLASANEEIRQKSINHCLNGINLSAINDCPFFAAHAGFCIDPSPNDLGNQLKFKNEFDLDNHWKLFFSSLDVLISHANSKKVQFLIENNVLATFNYRDSINPLLCCESRDIMKVFAQYDRDDYFGLLLDTAHLKVSCQTLNLNLVEELEKVSKYIRAIHHSDNNGVIDNNLPISNDYWQLQLLDIYGN
jgi:sugar phosphate isomerase/epimerase